MSRHKLVLIGLLVALVFIVLAMANLDLSPLPRDARADRVVVLKGRHQLQLMNGNEVLKTYRVALGRGGPSPKRQEGDGKTPEGTYTLSAHNAASHFHRAILISYPNADDFQRARTAGVTAGGNIELHGIKRGWGWLGSLHHYVDWTDGCIAVTDPEIDEIWRAVPDGTPIEIRP